MAYRDCHGILVIPVSALFASVLTYAQCRLLKTNNHFHLFCFNTFDRRNR